MDLEHIKLLISIVNIVITIGIFIYVRIDGGQRATLESIKEMQDDIDKRFGAKCERLRVLEAELKSIPTREHLNAESEKRSNDVNKLYERLNTFIDESHKTQLMLGTVLGEVKQINERLRITS